VAKEYRDNDFYSGEELEDTLGKLIGLCMHAPGANAMELFDILIFSVQQARYEQELHSISLNANRRGLSA
jgi:hypothetical protein